MGESWPDGATLGAFSMFFISISSWWIQRSGGLRSFWLPFLLLALWLALFLHRHITARKWITPWGLCEETFKTSSQEKMQLWRHESSALLNSYFLCWAEERRVQIKATTTTTTTVTAPTETTMMTKRLLFFWGVTLPCGGRIWPIGESGGGTERDAEECERFLDLEHLLRYL